MKNEKCIASNKTIAEILHSKQGSIANSLQRLEEEGFIKRIFSDKKRKLRKEIKPLIAYARVSLDNETVSSTNDTRVSSTNEQIENINTKKSITISTANAEDREVFNLFKEIKPSYEILFKRKHEWAAAKRLNAKYGISYLEKVVRLVKVSNKLPYAPIVTSPAELEEKMAKIEAFWIQRKGKVEEKNKSKFAFTK